MKRVNLHENENENGFSLLLLIKTLLKCFFFWWLQDLAQNFGPIFLQPPASCRESRFVWDTCIIYSKLSNCFAYHKKDFYVCHH